MRRRHQDSDVAVLVVFKFYSPTRGMRIWPSDQPTQATQMTKPLLLTLEISHKMFIGDWNRGSMPNAAAT